MSNILTVLPGDSTPAFEGDAWRDLASCLQYDHETFFPEEGDEDGEARAKQICATCPVVDYCLNYALETNQTEGVWGGKSRGERRSIRRRHLRKLRQAG